MDINGLIVTIIQFAKENGMEIILPTDEDCDIDFVNVNFKSGQVYCGNMGIENMLND